MALIGFSKLGTRHNDHVIGQMRCQSKMLAFSVLGTVTWLVTADANNATCEILLDIVEWMMGEICLMDLLDI